MTENIIWLTYTVLSLMTIWSITRIDVQTLSFLDGVVVGLAFYISAPLLVILFSGSITTLGIMAPPYVPTEDAATTLSIFIGWTSIIITHTLFRSNSQPVRAQKFEDVDYHNTLKIIILMYLAFQMYTFFQAGFAEDNAHWHNSLSSAFEESTSFIILRNFANSFRTIVFGILFIGTISSNIKPRTAIFIGATVCLVDLATSFNRITIVYFFFSFVLIYRARAWIILISATAAAPLVATLSNIWPLFRSTALLEGWSIDGILRAAENSWRYQPPITGTITESMNGIFESSNIVVLNYVVRNFGDTIPHFWGSTLLLRPLTTFIPSTIWQDKPRVFGTYLGEMINSVQGLALNSTLFGESIANFPTVWPLVLSALLVMFDRIYRFAGAFVPGAQAMAFFVAIAIWRFDLNFAAASLYAIGAIYLMGAVLRVARPEPRRANRT